MLCSAGFQRSKIYSIDLPTLRDSPGTRHRASGFTSQDEDKPPLRNEDLPGRSSAATADTGHQTQGIQIYPGSCTQPHLAASTKAWAQGKKIYPKVPGGSSRTADHKKVPGKSSLAAGTAGLRRPNIADRVSTRTVQGPGRKHRYRHTVLKMRPPCGPVFATIFWSKKQHEKRTPTVGVLFSCRFLARNLRSKK